MTEFLSKKELKEEEELQITLTKLLSEKELKEEELQITMTEEEEELQRELESVIWYEFYEFFDRICGMEPFDLDIIETMKDEFVVSLDELFVKLSPKETDPYSH